MALYNKAFFAMGLFLIGVFCASFMPRTSGALIVVFCVTICAALILLAFRQWSLALLCVAIIFGFSYFHWFNVRQQAGFTAPLNQQLYLTGLVQRVSLSNGNQSVDLQLQDEYRGLIRTTLRPYPVVEYGDVLQLSGALQLPDAASAGYFAKEGIGATIRFPKTLDFVAHNQGSVIKAKLFAIRDYVDDTFTKFLPPEQAMLMTGLVLGKSGGFSKEFNEKLKATGTTHIVALSGFNITVIVSSLLWLLGFVVNRRRGVWVCILFVVAFVVMTGAQASVVRAAVMAMIMILAEQSSRAYSVRNAIAAAAFVMTLFNPNVLAFDIGFQLSFLALLGIVYLQPAVEKFFRIDSDGGVLGWRKNAIASTSAQLAVLPIILTSFGFVSPLSIMTNVLLLSFISYTMAIGFFMVLARLLSGYLVFVVAMPAKILLGYELAVIDFFAKLPFGFQIEHLPIFASIAYYALLAAFITYVTRSKKYAAAI